MSKEIEALTRISEIKIYSESHNGYYETLFNASPNDFNFLLESLTPPTADEVCKALSEFLEHTVITRKNKHGITFNYDETKQTIISKNYDLLNIRFLLPTHLIALVGKFYEGVKHGHKG